MDHRQLRAVRFEEVVRGVESSEALRAHIGRRLQSSVGRFGARLRSVRVSLADINGPRGGVDMECRLHVVARGMPPIVISEVAEDMYAAITKACGRLGRVMARKVGRLQWTRDRVLAL